MKTLITRISIAAVVAGALVAASAVSANAAGTNTTQQNTSYGPLYLFDGNDLTAPSNSFAANDTQVIASSSKTAGDVVACQTGASEADIFAAAVGDESTPANWIASTTAAFTGVGQYNVRNAGVTLSSLTTGTPAALWQSGQATRTWSLGIACMDGSTVTRAYFRTITVTTATTAWTAAATDYVYPTPTLSYTLAGSSLHTGDTITASVGADSAVPFGFTPNYQWYAGTTPVANATNASYTLADTDGGKVFHVTVSYTRSGYTTVTRDSANTVTVQGLTNLGASITVTAGVVNALDGQLSLDVAPKDGSYTGAVTLNGTRNAVTNQSESTGNLPALTVTDGRVTSLGGWSLSATVSDFQRVIPGSPLSTADVIAKTQLGITPSITSKPADRTVNAGTARVAGDAFNSAFVLASTDAVATPGSSDKAYTGDTVVTAALKLVAPRWKTAGNYQSTMTVTLTQ